MITPYTYFSSRWEKDYHLGGSSFAGRENIMTYYAHTHGAAFSSRCVVGGRKIILPSNIAAYFGGFMVSPNYTRTHCDAPTRRKKT